MEFHTGNAYRNLDLCFTHAEVQSHRSCSHVMMQLGQTPHAIFEIRVYPRFVRTLTIRGSSLCGSPPDSSGALPLGMPVIVLVIFRHGSSQL